MKITNGSINNGIRGARSEAAEKKSSAGARQEKSGVGGADKVKLSGGLREVEKLAGVIASLPPGDAEKIESIKSRIADGTYNVSGHAVAEKMLRSLGILQGEGE